MASSSIHCDIRCALLLHLATSSSPSSPSSSSLSTIRTLGPHRITSRASAARRVLSSFSSSPRTASFRVRAFSNDESKEAVKLPEKPSICTADELHYVSVPDSDWRLALWRYRPCPKAPQRNHPLLLLSGVGTNAIGYDLSPESSFARYMSGQGFETWVLEVRGAGLSLHEANRKQIQESAHAKSEQMESVSKGATNGAFSAEKQSNSFSGALAKSEPMEAVSQSATDGAISTEKQSNSFPGASAFETPVHKINDQISAAKGDLTSIPTVGGESKSVTSLTETFTQMSERLSGFLGEGQSSIISANLLDQISKLFADSTLSERFNDISNKLSSLLETRQNSAFASQIRDLSQRLVNIIEEGQRSVSPSLFDLQERLSSTLEDFQKQLDLIVKYDWDFDHYLEEDIPAVMEYILVESKPKDGKLLAIGHSMGGILLYAMLSRCGSEGRTCNLAAVVTLASSLDYTSSKSTLKLLIPLADPAQALNVPVVPLGTLLAAAYPLSSRPPYVLSWLNDLISAQGMMHPELLKKLVLNNFCTIPAKLLLQLTTAFKEGGLRDRSGTYLFKDHIHKSNVPILALAGDKDLICPPEAVEETVKVIPEHLVTYKVFGESGGAHYAHYDLVGGRMAAEQVYPCIIEFLSQHD
ncbi:putative serine aminopeptidase, S33, alpha/Beta hydrolase [Rosa chinensis]|uniref:Putative serine aminopeptidase, S33, alpha/Beta hydrolase n=1 Tax=Rosa chinensis TaxID=74649 RepID=A0A2P6R1H5_ROSCH|nr:uncharacterized protein LOC112197337 [Rosa chinensis]PRQ40283.1 putative serine aminopeptidase, S33, alpha/Beta hydrolase [Rosa chinensis]